jgi:hypothetical protein
MEARAGSRVGRASKRGAEQQLKSEIQRRKGPHQSIKWMFTTDKIRAKCAVSIRRSQISSSPPVS